MDLAFPGFLRRSKHDQWPETTATIAECHALSGIWQESDPPVPLYSVRFVYWVNGHMYSGCFRAPQAYEAGSSLPLRYHPRHPERTTCDPPEKLKTELLVALSVGLTILYAILLLHR